MIDPNEPACPRLRKSYTPDHGEHVYEISGGLTIRAHFAAMAMQGALANQSLWGDLIGQATDEGGDIADIVAEAAVEYADALIAELNK